MTAKTQIVSWMLFRSLFLSPRGNHGEIPLFKQRVRVEAPRTLTHSVGEPR